VPGLKGAVKSSNSMRKRTIIIVISTCLLIPVISILVITSVMMTEGGMPSDEELISISEKLIDDSKIILRKYPVEASLINEEERPKIIKALSPLSVWVNHEGLYILTKKRFVEGWGVFIPREDSEKYLEKITIPSYDRIVKGIYIFYAD
jgi:hypothetical protein